MILPLLILFPSIKIDVNPDQVLGRNTSAMFGACIEDVNHEIYGGLYAQRIFGESFEEPAPGTSPKGWQAIDGTWTPDGQGVHGAWFDGAKLVCDMPALANGVVEAQLVVFNDLWENAGLLVRVSNPRAGADAFSGYEVSLVAREGRLLLGKHQDDFHPLVSAPVPAAPGVWYRIRVQLDGPRIRVYLDDEPNPRIDFVDGDHPILSGKVALRTWHADASFKDIKINGQTILTPFTDPGISGMWDEVHTGSAVAQFALEDNAFNGALCQKIVHGPGAGEVGIANRGLNRWGISVRKGHPMEGRVYLHALRQTNGITVALQSQDGSKTYATQRLTAGTSWQKAAFALTPSVTDPNARFAIWLDRPGQIWVDQAVLLDANVDRFHGLPIRRDIAEELIKGGYTSLRYGGTMINAPGYRWKNMIGSPDRRPPYHGFWYPYSTNGFGIFDFLTFCEAAHMESAFTINPEESPEDAADLADYLTAPSTTPWGRRRAQNGHPAPFAVKYLEIGNEEGIGNTSPRATAHYAERFRLLAHAIHTRNPKIKLVCGAWWVPDAAHMKTVFDAIDGVADAWDFHFWCDDLTAGTNVGHELDRAQTLFHQWNPKTNLKVVVFEENGNRHDVQRALGHATTLNATRRRGDFVLADSAANCLQPLHQNNNGWDQGQVFFTPDRTWRMPPAEVQRLAAKNYLPLCVAVKADGGLDAFATRSEDGKVVVLTVVNPTDQSVQIKPSYGNFHARKSHMWTLTGELTSEAIKETESELSQADQEVMIPSHSVTTFRVSR